MAKRNPSAGSGHRPDYGSGLLMNAMKNPDNPTDWVALGLSLIRPKASPAGIKYVRNIATCPYGDERAMQRELFRRIEATNDPTLNLAYHISNENAHRNPGVRGGVPDICLPVARSVDGKSFNACYLELKVNDNSPSEKQVSFMQSLITQGNFCVVVWNDPADALAELQAYLGNDILHG